MATLAPGASMPMPIAGFMGGNIDTGGENDCYQSHEDEFRSVKHNDALFYAKHRTVGNRYGIAIDAIKPCI
jgi:hypothetical protein